MAGEVFLHRFPLCILWIYLVPAVWQESSRSVSLIQMYPVSERCRTVVCALDAFFISHPSVQIISYNFYLLLVRNLVFRHKFLPLWKQCFISLSLIEGAYQTSGAAFLYFPRRPDDVRRGRCPHRHLRKIGEFSENLQSRQPPAKVVRSTKKETPTKEVGLFVGHAKRPVRSDGKFVNTHNRHGSGNLL